MYQGTTPALTLRIDGANLTGKTVFVTIRCGSYILTKTGDSLAVAYDEDHSVVIVRLSQLETLRMEEPEAQIQVRFIDSNGNAEATKTATFNVEESLYQSVISYNYAEGD